MEQNPESSWFAEMVQKFAADPSLLEELSSLTGTGGGPEWPEDDKDRRRAQVLRALALLFGDPGPGT